MLRVKPSKPNTFSLTIKNLYFKNMLEKFRVKVFWELIWGKISPNTKVRSVEKKM